ncbi:MULTISPECIES: hypothetical protein [Actinomadura]|uniref:Uncharacterized protein n=1 Tax=Actinomadura yumaensis TaxID=111807 RepID=A0ABW2CF02_9ACTN|nr:hypothetical protein [Actinomadura sp. J1-007]MWK35571.1 hypothetical protein [Actinomadura sp. J1-007]
MRLRTVLTALAAAVAVPAACAGPALADPPARQINLIVIDHSENDAIVEIDRTLNTNDGSGSAGSDIVSNQHSPHAGT